MNPRRVELLQAMPIFGAVQAEVLDYILRTGNYRSVRQGDYYFREGDLADAMYVLERGAVAAYRNWQGTDFKLRDMRPGDCFGEMALLDCRPRSASVVALKDSAAIEISGAQLSEIYQKYPDQFLLIHMNMAREVCRRLRAADRRLFEITLGNEHTEVV